MSSPEEKRAMNRYMTLKISLVIFAGLALCSGGAAVADSNPYQAIITRNVFGLKDPPPPTKVVEPAKPSLKLTLTGIITLGKARALMTAPPAQPRPGEQPKGQQSFILAEGERDGEVEVVSIDPALGKVALKVGGESMTIGFEDNSRSKGGPVGIPLAPMATFSGAIPTQRSLMPAIPQSQPVELAQATQTGEADATASAAAMQPQAQTASALQQTAAPGSQAAGTDNPYARRAIQHAAADPSLGAAQIRRPFPTRSQRGRGFAAYQVLPTPDPAAEAPAQPAAQ
jgi:hypothetical protein